MSEQQKRLVPKLRFPEFRGAWPVLPIGDKVELLSGYPFDGPDISQDDSGVPLLRGINVTEGRVRHSIEIDRYFTGPLNDLEKYRLQVDDLVIAMDGSKVGKNSALINQFDAGALLIQRVARLRATGSQSINFIFQLINSTVFHRYVDKINTSSGIPHISAKQIKEFSIAFPSAAEQQKIADCLSSLDELIAAQARKVEALKTHKKGLMQQLFPIEGETQPRLRFPEFRGTEEWVRAILGDLSKVVRGGSPRPIDGFLTTLADGLNWLKIGDVDKEAKYVTHTEEKVRPEALSKTRVVSPGDLILSNSMSFGRPYILQIETCIHDGWIAITDIDRMAERDFLYYSISAPNSQSYFIDNAAGSGVKNLNVDIIKALQVCFPSSAEQQKIADCLSTLDELLATQVRKVEALKTHKKGLMQQLFPSGEVDA